MKIECSAFQKNTSYSVLLMVAALLTGCGSVTQNVEGQMFATPTVDYVESLDVYSAPHKDSFLNQLAMNYRSYAIYNARTSGYADVGELFANKAVAAFSGDVPYPESLENWPVQNEQEAFELSTAYNDLIEYLKNDVVQTNPDLAAEMQAKFDCWLSASATGQYETADQCRDRFVKALNVLKGCDKGTDCFVSAKDLSPVSEMSEEVVVEETVVVSQIAPFGGTVAEKTDVKTYYPDTYSMKTVRGATRPREGVIVVNNVNVPKHLINPEPVQPIVFNQNIFGGDKTVTKSATDNSVTDSNNSVNVSGCQHGDHQCDMQQQSNSQLNQPAVAPMQNQEPAPSFVVTVMEKDLPQVECPMCNDEPECAECEKCQKCQECQTCQEPEACPDCVLIAPDVDCPVCKEVVIEKQIPMVGEELVTRAEFIDMMMAMRAELQAINARLDKLQATAGEKTMIKVQQIPLEPTQRIMEEVFEVRFDFNKAIIKPEYQELIKKLAAATQDNKNIKVSVVGHTDTAGSGNYNYALGGRRADAVQKMLIQYGIPASQIVAVSAGEEDLAVPTPDNTPNAENRRVRVVKEIPYTEEVKPVPMAIEVEEYSAESCGEYGC